MSDDKTTDALWTLIDALSVAMLCGLAFGLWLGGAM